MQNDTIHAMGLCETPVPNDTHGRLSPERADWLNADAEQAR
jgi:hypothetical protein